MKPRIPIPPTLGPTFTHSAALATGLGKTRLTGDDLARPFHGVRSLLEPSTLLDRCRAYATRAPDDAYFSHSTAALLHGAPLPFALAGASILHVSRPHPADVLSAKGIRGHSVVPASNDVQSYLGLRVSTATRTWCDLGSVLSVPDLVAVGDFYLYRKSRMMTIAELASAVHAYPGRRGIRNLRDALPLLDDNVRSRRESLFRVFLVANGFFGFVTNMPLTLFGKYHEIDIAFPALMVALEYDGDYHRDQKEWRKTMTRRARLEAAGWRVMQINADDLRDPVELAARLRAFMAR